jgi:hypothetical protein
MSEKIGAAAGQIWMYLKSNTKVSAAQIQKAIKADAALTNQAIGWLAREGKIAIDRSKRTATYNLNE